MDMFSRFTNIINSSINALLDNAKDHKKIIRLIIQEIKVSLFKIPSSCAHSMADKKIARVMRNYPLFNPRKDYGFCPVTRHP